MGSRSCGLRHIVCCHGIYGGCLQIHRGIAIRYPEYIAVVRGSKPAVTGIFFTGGSVATIVYRQAGKPISICWGYNRDVQSFLSGKCVCGVVMDILCCPVGIAFSRDQLIHTVYRHDHAASAVFQDHGHTAGYSQCHIDRGLLCNIQRVGNVFSFCRHRDRMHWCSDKATGSLHLIVVLIGLTLDHKCIRNCDNLVCIGSWIESYRQTGTFCRYCKICQSGGSFQHHCVGLDLCMSIAIRILGLQLELNAFHARLNQVSQSRCGTFPASGNGSKIFCVCTHINGAQFCSRAIGHASLPHIQIQAA